MTQLDTNNDYSSMPTDLLKDLYVGMNLVIKRSRCEEQQAAYQRRLDTVTAVLLRRGESLPTLLFPND